MRPRTSAVERTERALSREDYDLFAPMIRREALWFSRHAPRLIEARDLSSRAWCGLLEVLRTQPDGALPASFENKAIESARSAMLDYVQSLDPEIGRVRALSRRISQTIRELIAENHSVPDQFDVCRALGVTMEEFRESLLRVDLAGIARVEVLDFDRPNHPLSNEESLREESIAAAVTRLPSRLKVVLMLLNQEQCSVEEAASVLDVSQRDICVARSEAIHFIRALLQRD